MTSVEDLIRDLPDPESARRFLVRLAEKHSSHERKLVKNHSLLSDVLTLVAYSPLLAETVLQHPEYIAWLGRKRGESVVRNKEELLESLARFSLTNSQVEPHILLSRFRRRELLRIYLRDIRRLATVAEITEEISNLADAILEHALRLSRQELDNRFGPPQAKDEKGRARPADICIVSLGKLGSKELNYSSDIDLLFIYSDEGTTAGIGSRDPVTNREYFVKLAEHVTRLVGKQTGEGAAYRVDLRLRPHGRVGPLALSLADTVRYYTGEAQPWERQVLIRSRSGAGSENIFKEFSQAVGSRVFSSEVSIKEALSSVRESKQKIDLENINAKGINVKLGRGGIREIEFIAQALQLAYGGRDKWLRSPHTLISLSRLSDRKLLTETELSRLSEAYAFFRKLEHILQMENGLQTHTIPNDGAEREVLARRMRFDSLHEFDETLGTYTEGVHGVFRRVFGDAPIFESSNGAAEMNGPDANSAAFAAENEAHSAPFISALTGISPRLAELTAADPGLIASLPGPEANAIERDYRHALRNAIGAEKDFRSRLSILRKSWHRLLAEILAFDAMGKLAIRDAKKLQTTLAEASIDAALEITRGELRKRYGAGPDDPSFAVMGLGKLGGAGVDYDSDLDLVIVYDETPHSTGERAVSSTDNTGPHASAGANAPSPLANAELSSRAVEIFVNTLSAMTRDGSLYRVDLRLRPHGKDGPLAISRKAFAEYMRGDAAIWELLAFVKLRGVGGNIGLAKEIETEIRRTIHEKAGQIDPDELAAETRRIRLSLEKQRADVRRSRDIDIKYGEGGMLDIYFAIRFLQLRDNVPDNDASRSTDAALTKLRAAGSLSDEAYRTLLAGYEFLSALDHNLRLTVGRTTRLPLANKHALNMIAERMHLASVAELLEKLTTHRIDVRSAFEEVINPA